MAQPGDRCESCEGHYIVVNTIQSSLATIRYIGCRGCGHRPLYNKLVQGSSEHSVMGYEL